MDMLERRVALLEVIRSALTAPHDVAVRIGAENEAAGAALAGAGRRQLRAAAAQPGHGLGDRAAADGLRRAIRAVRRRPPSCRPLSPTSTTRDEMSASQMPRDYYEVLGVARDAGEPRSRRPFAGWPASCTPTSTATIRRLRRSSRRPPRPMRSCRTLSVAPPMTATATRACAPAATRPTSTPLARSPTSLRRSSAAGGAFGSAFGGGRPGARRRRRYPVGGRDRSRARRHGDGGGGDL